MNEFFAGILNGINTVVQNYGWSMVVFTILIKLIIVPLDYKSRKSMRRMSSLQPQLTKLQKKYANDKEKLNVKMSELYRKEHINPMSGCLPMLISMPVLFIMFAAMRMVANTELAKQALEILTVGTQTSEGWLWVKNVWMPDSPFYGIISDASSLKMIPADIWAQVFSSQTAESLNQLAALGINASTITGDTVFAALQNTSVYLEEMKLWSTMPSLNLILVQLTIYANNNGWFILPILACVTQFLMTATQPQQPQVEGQPNTNKFMKYFFPLFSLFICSSYNAAFSLYWVVSNIFAWVEGIVMNKMFEKQELQGKEAIEEESIK
ncbi:MAG: YidC/Oxa1 family membrane protein insertase [Eubacteriales bacterium]|nr:YidC/Oxa1 family membrane protein insertase [Eubacteriales bacterium]